MATATAATRLREPDSFATAFAAHWPEYLMEAALLGMFMISACTFGVLLNHPGSAIAQGIDNEFVRRVLGGLAMGATAILLILSPFGKRSGAHFNPAVTIAYSTLGKIAWRDAAFYVLAQFAGGILGIAVADKLLGPPLRHSAVNYVVTAPAAGDIGRAFAGEFLISGTMLSTVLLVSNRRNLARFTPFFAGSLVALFITFESPISGMSMNPARTFGSGFGAGEYMALWIYFTAPPLAMIAAAQFYRWLRGSGSVYCAKFHHDNNQRCIFRCRYDQMWKPEHVCKTETITT
jgi:aquaporin Z